MERGESTYWWQGTHKDKSGSSWRWSIKLGTVLFPAWKIRVSKEGKRHFLTPVRGRLIIRMDEKGVRHVFMGDPLMASVGNGPVGKGLKVGQHAMLGRNMSLVWKCAQNLGEEWTW
jgi:hypothetical protein